MSEDLEAYEFYSMNLKDVVTRKCRHCGSLFETRHRTQRYCKDSACVAARYARKKETERLRISLKRNRNNRKGN